MKIIKREPDKGYLGSLLAVPKSQINVDGTKRALEFNVMDDRKMRFLAMYEETEDHLHVPREFWDVHSLPYQVVDVRPKTFHKTGVASRITLDAKSPTKTTQRDAVRAMREAEGGILQLACGKGKTICALELIAQEGVPAIIIVDNTQLMEQWQKQIADWLDIPGGLGLVQGDSFEWDKNVVIATYQTLALRAAEFPEEARRWFGLIIWDEAHHMAAPTWAVTADLFFGKRIGLTATPTRPDGMHVIYDFHLGKVLYKDLTQELVPDIYFYWTGITVDPHDPRVREQVVDVNGEMHIQMLCSYFGQHRPRLELMIAEVQKAVAQNRKVLFLSYSIDELVNLLAIWNKATQLYTDVPAPTHEELGEKIPPVALDIPTRKRLMRKMMEHREYIKANPKLEYNQKRALELQIADYKYRIQQDDVANKVRLEHEKRQRSYVQEMLKLPSTAGLMIGAIKPKERQRMLKEKQVTFAIMKYGREGLDEPSLDTVFVAEPMSQKNALQQLMGRVLRKKDGKKKPIVMFFEDDVGPMIGMCTNLRRHLRTWPLEEGGPFEYVLLGHPRKGKGHAQWT